MKGPPKTSKIFFRGNTNIFKKLKPFNGVYGQLKRKGIEDLIKAKKNLLETLKKLMMVLENAIQEPWELI